METIGMDLLLYIPRNVRIFKNGYKATLLQLNIKAASPGISKAYDFPA
jgi:hypothetical protein